MVNQLNNYSKDEQIINISLYQTINSTKYIQKCCLDDGDIWSWGTGNSSTSLLSKILPISKKQMTRMCIDGNKLNSRKYIFYSTFINSY